LSFDMGMLSEDILHELKIDFVIDYAHFSLILVNFCLINLLVGADISILSDVTCRQLRDQFDEVLKISVIARNVGLQVSLNDISESLCFCLLISFAVENAHNEESPNVDFVMLEFGNSLALRFFLEVFRSNHLAEKTVFVIKVTKITTSLECMFQLGESHLLVILFVY